MPIVLNGSGPITGVTSLNTTVSDTEIGYLDGVTSNIQTQLNSKGKILQVVSTTKTDTFTTTSSTFTDVTGLSVSITPTSATSKVFVMFSVTGNGNTGNAGLMIRLVRDSTAVAVGSAAGSRTQATIGNIEEAGPNAPAHTMDLLDSPATTSATTYKIQVRSNVNGQTVTVNRSLTDTDAATFARTVSTITVMEVSA